MPRNFKEAMLFTTMMCGGMVLGMSIWNLFLVGQFSIGHLVGGYLPAFILAFLLDVLIVGPVVKFFAFQILKEHHKRWQKILTISGGMAILMVSFMSLYGLFTNGVPINAATYGTAWRNNFIMAIPLNFLIVGPVARYILTKFQHPFENETTVETFEDDDEIPTII